MIKRKRMIIIGLVIAIIIVTVLALYKRQWSVEYTRLLNGNAEISSIILSGGGKQIEIKDQDIIRDFENALVNERNFQRVGATYEVKFIFKSGVRINTELYLYEDKSGFQLADYSDPRITFNPMADPRYVGAKFKPNVSQKTKDLISKLLK